MILRNTAKNHSEVPWLSLILWRPRPKQSTIRRTTHATTHKILTKILNYYAQLPKSPTQRKHSNCTSTLEIGRLLLRRRTSLLFYTGRYIPRYQHFLILIWLWCSRIICTTFLQHIKTNYRRKHDTMTNLKYKHSSAQSANDRCHNEWYMMSF